MAAPGGFSYKPNVNRAITKKWKDATQVSYGGDDWGDDDNHEYGNDEQPPASATNSRQPAWPAHGQAPSHPQAQGGQHTSNRSVTNPSPSRSAGRSSFDRGDERRNFSAGGTSGFESAYPTAQRNPFPEVDPEFDQPQYPRHAAPLSLQTQGPAQGPYPPPAFRPGSRGQPQRPYVEAPFSAPPPDPHRRSESGNRPAPASAGPPDMYQRRQSPVRPDSRSSNTSGKYFPPRKSSLSHAQPPDDIIGGSISQPQNAPAAEEKPPPAFVRPADIYKRIEQEREKERRSQDSSRPSIDLNPPKTRDSSTSARSIASEPREPLSLPTEDSDSTRRLKPTLDTVVERKSEYGFDNLLKGTQSDNASQNPTPAGVHRDITDASSVYTDRPDPVSASSMSRHESLAEYPEQEEPSSSKSHRYNLPSIDRMSSFGTDLTPLTFSITQSDHPAPVTSAYSQDMPAVSGNNQSNDQARTQGNDIDRQPSLGYRSVVNQAFDESQIANPLSAVSESNTIPRSNSASTSDISPVMSKRAENNSGFTSNLPISVQAIPEEPASPDTRPLPSSTITPALAAKEQQPLPAPPVIHAGYRRDVTPPGRDNSPAKRPLSVDASNGFKSQRATVEPYPGESATADILAAADEDHARGRVAQTFPAVAVPQTSNDNSTNPSLLVARTTSEEYEEWRSEKKQFNTRFGFQDSNPTTPGIPSPVSRAESPPKGTVRGMTERLETQSGSSTPVNAVPEERPTHQPRMESFRPPIPGSWQSFTGTPAVATPVRDETDPLKPPTLLADRRHDSSDSIPTAKAPTHWDQNQSHTSGGAFAAAAAAGTALAGAFSGPALTHDAKDDSHESSDDDEWDRSPVSRSPQHGPSDTRDFALPQHDKHLPTLNQMEESKPPTPLPKDTPAGESAPFTHPTAHMENRAQAQDRAETEDYFPAPLRMSRSIDPQGLIRPALSNPTLIEESTDARDNEQLQQDIVKSLTPKSSIFDGQPTPLPATKALFKNDGDLYGSGLSTPMASAGVNDAAASEAIHQSQPSVSTVSTASPERPIFPHRFSWETDGAAHSTPPAAKSPNTLRQVSSGVPQSSPQTPSGPQTPAGPQIAVTNVSSPVLTSPVPNTTSFSPNMTSPSAPSAPGGMQGGASLRKIMNIGNHQARMDAYSQNRDLYAHSDQGLLEQWILSLKETPEHADMFSGQHKSNVAAPNRPSPGRALPSIGGGKMMPEDGKKLIAAAGRFGGKAGGAAKGLFARGKEKLRQASASDKSPKTNRRKSAGPSLLQPDEPDASNRNSLLLTAPPQIPAQDLSSSPIDSSDWALMPNRRTDEDPVISRLTSINDNWSSALHSTQRTNENPVKADSPQGNRKRDSAVIASSLQASHPLSAHQRDGESSDPKQGFVSGAESGDGYGQDGSYMPPSQRAAEKISNSQPQSNAADQPEDMPTAPIAAKVDPPASPNRGLTVPDEGRRRSVVSDVSSASPSPAKEHDESHLDRGVSPAEENVPVEDTVPIYDPSLANPSKEQEAMRDRTVDDQDHLPAYDENDPNHAAQRQPHVAPGAPIVAVADLSHQKRMEVNRTTARPFSFDGSEILNQALRSAPITQHSEELHKVPSQPMSPVSQTLSKSLSQVSVEEVNEDQNDASKRQSRSYSRPFGADPVRDHPALKQPSEMIERSQLYSTESPLPSARRTQPEAVHHQVTSPRVVEREEEEEGYRIPGPYRQEYRSPRQNSFPKPQNPSQPTSEASPARYQPVQMGSHQPQHSEYPPAQTNQPMGPPKITEASRPKKGPFSGLFRNRSSSRSRPGMQEDSKVSQKNVRRRNSRQDSLVSQQSSLNEARDVVGQLPSSDNRQKRFSRDMTRPGSSASVDQVDGKKKRFSGMGLFSRGSKGQNSAPPQRSSTLPHNFNQPMKNKNFPPDQQNMYGDMVAPSRQFPGSPPPGSGYYAPMDGQAGSWGPRTPQYQQGQMQQQYQQRPADLRIDTSSGSRNTQSLPATAPPQTYANRDISYQSRPYVPPNARLPTADAGTIPRGPSPRVVDLHKRSRSPKLGRYSEDEGHVTKEEPAGNLGTFINKKISPVGGVPRPDEDQEAPFRIALPGEGSEDKRRTRQFMIEQGSIKDGNRGSPSSPIKTVSGNVAAQTVAERMAGPQIRRQGAVETTAAARAPAPRSTVGKGNGFVAELPGSKAEGYESEEEVQMSATAYPGAWQDPVYFAEGRWDD